MIVFSSLQIRRGVRVLLDNATATINPGQKVGLVGKNGCGKSTLLALLKNEISADGGSYTFPGSWQLAWVNQETPALPQAALEYVIDGDREYRQLEAQLHDANERNDGHAIATIHGKLDAIDAWSIRSRAASLLHGLGFSNEQLERPVSDFSGGWRMRLNLAQALICRSDLLLLDEPTNHLDLDAVIWLEKWLKSYQGTLILISHDRDFLDPIVDKIIHIEQQSMFEYTGNYSSFEVQRATRLAQQQAMYESQQERVAHLQSYIDRFRAKATKAKQAQSRIKMLERMELIAPAHVDNPFRFSFRAPESLPNPLLKMEKVSAGYGDRIILDSIKLNLVPGSRIGLLGRNGAGKSTLIKLLAGELAPVSGEIGLAKGIKLGYFAQHQLEYLRADESPIQHLARLAPQELEQKLRDYLGGFGFQGDKVTEETRRFSGGEKARLVLALIVWQRPNLLLLDEPTNHLDLDMRQALTEALIEFEGALVVVSHDRHLLRSTTDDLYLVHDRKVEPFDGDLEDYQQWLSDVQKQENQTDEAPKENANSAQARKDQKRREAELRAQTQPLRKEIARLEKEMEKLNAQLAQAEEKLGDSELYDQSRKAELTACLQQQASAKSGLEECEMAWLEAQEQLEQMLLEGSLKSPYAHGLVEAAQKRGWLGVVMHFRGCSGEPNRMHRIYHSGETEDASWFLRWLQREFGHAPTAAVGYSLGGNMLACLLAKEGNDLPVDAAVIVSAPFMLEACSYHMEKGFSRVYQRYLLNLLKANAARKLAAYPGTLPINLAQLKSVRRIREFDDLITARIHGYADAIDYYRQCSAMPMLNRIAKPTLIIHAKDDPFMDHQVIPKPESLPPQVEYQLTEHGGHVGFIGGTLLHPQMWLESRIPDWLTTYLEAKSC